MTNGWEVCIVCISVRGHSVRAVTGVICLLIISSEGLVRVLDCKVNCDEAKCKALRVDTGPSCVM